MNNTEREIQQLQTEIDQQKLKVKEAIKNGAMFEEIKKITLYINQLEKRLASYVANPNDKNQV